MSVTAEITASPTFPAGTLVGIYEQRFYPGHTPITGKPPGVAPVKTATVLSNGELMVPGCEPERQYIAGAEVQEWRYISFIAPPAPAGGAATPEEVERLIHEAEVRGEQRAREGPPWYMATANPGVDMTGAADSGTALMTAAQSAINKKLGLMIPGGALLLNSTPFDTSLLDFSPVEKGGAISWEIYCSASLRIRGGALTGTKPVISLNAPPGKFFTSCRFWLPLIEGYEHSGPGVLLRAMVDSFLEIGGIYFAGKGLWMEGIVPGLTQPCGNNEVHLQASVANTIGVHLESVNESAQCTANSLYLGQINANAIAVQTDSETALGSERQSRENFIQIRAQEINEVVCGSLDFAPSNKWQIDYSEQNGPSRLGPGYIVGNGMPSPGPAYVRGFITDGLINGELQIGGEPMNLIHLPEHGCDILNSALEAGKVPGIEPNVLPASGEPFVNRYERPLKLYIAPSAGNPQGSQTFVTINGINYPITAPIPENELTTIPRKKETLKVGAEKNVSFLALTGARQKGWYIGRQVKVLGGSKGGTAGGALTVGSTYYIATGSGIGAHSFAITATETGAGIAMKETEELELEVLPDKPSITSGSNRLVQAHALRDGYYSNVVGAVNTGARLVKLLGGSGGGTAGGKLTMGNTYFIKAMGEEKQKGEVSVGSKVMKGLTSTAKMHEGETRITAGPNVIPNAVVAKILSATEIEMNYASVSGGSGTEYTFMNPGEYTISASERSAAIVMAATEELEMELLVSTVRGAYAQYFDMLPGQVMIPTYETLLRPAMRLVLGA